jgi:pyrroloquinoline quinone biosynthesis protein D
VSTKLAKATARFSETTIDDEVVVMSLESGDFFSLTGTAGAIWALIDGTRNRAGLLTALAAQFDVEENALTGDLDAFLTQLEAAGLLEAG